MRSCVAVWELTWRRWGPSRPRPDVASSSRPRDARVRAFCRGASDDACRTAVQRIFPCATAAPTPGRTAAGLTATTATRAGSSRRGALTVTCAKKKNGGKGKGAKGKNAATKVGGSSLKKESRAERAFRQPGATSSSGDGVWDSIQVGADERGQIDGVDKIDGVDNVGVDLDVSFDEEEADDERCHPPRASDRTPGTPKPPHAFDGAVRADLHAESVDDPGSNEFKFALKRVDSDGYWALISSGIVFGTFLLESYNMSSFGGWDVLYRDDISWYTGLISMKDAGGHTRTRTTSCSSCECLRRGRGLRTQARVVPDELR